FDAGTEPGDRRLTISRKRGRHSSVIDVDGTWAAAAETGWAYVELPEKLTVRTDLEIARTLSDLVGRLLQRGAEVGDERNKQGRLLTPERVAVIAAHNDQVQAVR